MRQVTIIGAGPAGAIAALILASHGWQVSIVEQHAFPRDKVCGECVSDLGIHVIDRVGAGSALRSLKPVQLTHAAIHATDGTSARVPLVHSMWGLSRPAMDSALLELARGKGVAIHQPARCEGIDPAVEHRGFDRGIQRELPPTVHVRDLATNQLDHWKPDWVLLADGKSAMFPERPLPTRDFGLKAHFRGIRGPLNTIELFGLRGLYGGIAPVENDCWNVAFSVPKHQIETSGGKLDSLFSHIVSDSKGLAERFAQARRVSDWLVSPLPRFAVTRTWPAGIIPIGNAAAALEPIGGEGMGLAMRSAELAAEFLNAGDHYRTALDVALLQKQFRKLWQSRRHFGRLAGRVLSSQSLSGPTIAWLASNDALAAFAFRLIGKT